MDEEQRKVMLHFVSTHLSNLDEKLAHVTCSDPGVKELANVVDALLANVKVLVGILEEK